MDKKYRKISFFTLIKKSNENNFAFFEINNLIKFIKGLKEQEGKYELKKQKKACSLETITIDDTHKIITGVFKSAERHYRPPLWDLTNNTERENPKKITEGDKEKTHFAIKITDEEVYFALEVNGRGITINDIIAYFNFFKEKYLKSIEEKQNFTICYYKVGKGNFLEELKKLNRVRIATVAFNKSILGSEALNFSNRTETLQDDIMLTLKAKRKQSISKQLGVAIYNKYSGKNDIISKIRIEGNNEKDERIILDTNFIEKIEYANVSLNLNTGEVQTQEMLSFLKSFLNNL